MADQYDSLAKRYGFPPMQIPAWRKAVGAPPLPDPSLVNAHAPPPSVVAAASQATGIQDPATMQSWLQPGPAGNESAPMSGPMSDALAAANRRPGQPPAKPAPMPSLFAPDGSMRSRPGGPAMPAPDPADLRQPKNGDWADHNKFIDKQEATRAKENLEGATFAEPPPVDASLPGKPQLLDPGGRRPAGWQVTEGLDLGPDAEQAVRSADERNRAAAGADYMAGQKAAEFERGYLEKYNKAAENYALEENRRAERFSSEYEKHMGALDEIRGKIREAQIDPFGGMPAGVARLGGAIAVALGAFASKNGENAGLAAIKHGIETNIRVQAEKLEKLERGAKGEAGFLGMLKQQFGDINAAKSAARVAYLEAAKSELAAALGSPEVADPRLLAGYERLQAKLDDELVNRIAHFKGITSDRVVRHDVNAKPVYAGTAVSPEAKHDARYLSEANEKAGIPAALSQLKDVDRVVDALGDGPIPGIGMIEGRIPSAIAPDRWVAGRQAVQAVKNAIGHSIFGGALSPTEAEKLNEQLDGAKDAASLRRTVQAFRAALQHRAANIAAGASPEGVALYEQRGGSVQRGAPSARQVSPDKPTAPHVREAK